MDSHSFQVEAHFKSTLRNVSGVKDIIQMNNKLFAECKALDNDLQTLVYDNYLTFIEAADTISELNSELKGLDTELDSLSKSIETSNAKF